MGILPVVKSTQVKNYFVTLGPQNPAFGDSEREEYLAGIKQVLFKNYGHNLEKACTSFEVTTDGYYHLHIVISLKSELRWSNCWKGLVAFHNTTERNRKEHRLTSCFFGYMAAANNIHETMCKYLTKPSKEKQVGDFTELEFEEFDYFNGTILGSTNQMFWDLIKHEYCDRSLDNGRKVLDYLSGKGPEPRRVIPHTGRYLL